MKQKNIIFTIIKKELLITFTTPPFYIFSISFLVILGVLTFYIGNFFARNQADLKVFFYFHPWLYLFLIPAITMNSWSDEYKSNTIEVLLTLGIPINYLVIAKFLANWLSLLIVISLTFPIWISINILGDPDNGLILANYLTSILLMTLMVAIGCFSSSLAKNQITSLIIAVSISFLLIFIGFGDFTKLLDSILPSYLSSAIYSMSIWPNFSSMINGLISLSNVIYFLITTCIFIYANEIAINFKLLNR